MKVSSIKYYLIFFSLAWVLSGCGTFKHAKNPLLNKNKIVFHGDKYTVDKENIKSILTQTPNKKLLGFWRFKLYTHQLPDRGKENKFRLWMRKSFGEPPVFYEPQLVENTKRQIQLYLNKSGYFNSKVWVEQDFKKHTFKQYFHIELQKPYRIRNFSYQISDTLILQKINEIKNETYIRSNDIYNAFVLDDERDRITEYLRNKGFYNFRSEFIYYEVDSALNNHQMDVVFIVKEQEKTDLLNQFNIHELGHKQYKINRVFINPDYDLLNPNPKELDTLLLPIQRDTIQQDIFPALYHFLYLDDIRIKPKTIANSILIKPGDYFSLEDVNLTYRRLSDLRNFKYTNIYYVDIVSNTLQYNLLDCHIDLSRSLPHSYSFEIEGTNSGGNFGIGANLIYNNKNIFKGAEIFQIRLSTSMEAHQINSNIKTIGNEFLLFNTIQTGIEIGLRFPRFLIPIKIEVFPKKFNPFTTLNMGFNYQLRPNYKRYITNFSFGYEWTQNTKSRHIFNPFELSVVKVYPTSDFAKILEEETNERIKNQYTDHLLPALKYSYIYNSQNIKKQSNFIYFYLNFETSGFLLKAIQTLFKKPETNGFNTLFNIRYAQYFRTDADFRYYNIINTNNRLVFRTFFGIGYAYGNSKDLPLEKGFFAGGANGMRGWSVRSLGPGSSTHDDNLSERIGDIRIEFNVEYRFPIYRFVKGALFFDAGNIWRINNDVIPNGAFRLNNFLNEIALDSGLGFRFDFRFFIFRIDCAIRLTDPAMPKGNRWVLKNTGLNKIMWNFGIGYPF